MSALSGTLGQSHFICLSDYTTSLCFLPNEMGYVCYVRTIARFQIHICNSMKFCYTMPIAAKLYMKIGYRHNCFTTHMFIFSSKSFSMH